MDRKDIGVTAEGRCDKDARPPFAHLAGQPWQDLFGKLPTPCYILDEGQLKKNGEILCALQQRTGCRILLAQKAFSNFPLYPVLAPYLAGTEASGLYEARLGAEEMASGEVHVFCAAYQEETFGEILRYADHIVFNSLRQLAAFGPLAKDAGKQVGLRINPECSTQTGHAIYDPCAPGSRLGVTRRQWDREGAEGLFSLLDGLHFHTLCEQDADALQITLRAVGESFGDILPRMKWLNFGGGHHITRPGYDLATLETCITDAQERWGLLAYLEPGEACALNAGYLCARVLDIVENGAYRIAILDASAACHMPDVIEMPYTPPLYGATSAQEAEARDASEAGAAHQDRESKTIGEVPVTEAAEPYVYRLAGPTCLAGDIIGDYHFPHPLQVGDRLLFGDMAIYTTCKNNTFNGMPLPDIWKWGENGALTRLAHFGYQDFKYRLGAGGKQDLWTHGS